MPSIEQVGFAGPRGVWLESVPTAETAPFESNFINLVVPGCASLMGEIRFKYLVSAA